MRTIRHQVSNHFASNLNNPNKKRSRELKAAIVHPNERVNYSPLVQYFARRYPMPQGFASVTFEAGAKQETNCKEKKQKR
jgi:hypothetical protein